MRTRLMVVATLVALVAAACGSGPSSDEVATLEDEDSSVLAASEDVADDSAEEVLAEELDTEEAMLAFTECLRKQGLDVADPEIDVDGNFRFRSIFPQGDDGAGSQFREQFQEAREICGVYLEGVTQTFQERDLTEMQDQLYLYAACMRENGYDMADPDLTNFGQGGGQGDGPRGPFGDIDPDDETFQAADEVCQDLFTGGFGFGRGGPGGGQG